MNFLRWTITVLIVLLSSVQSIKIDAAPSQGFIGTSAESSYKISSNVVSQNCEFYVDSLGDAHDSSQDARWLEAQIHIGDIVTHSANSLLNTGAYVEYIIDSNNNSHTELFFQSYGNPNFLHRIPYSDANPNQPGYKKISVFTFFIDVLTPNQGVIRYWITSKAYTFQATFWGYPYLYVDRGNGSGVTYTQYPSPVLDRRKACTRNLF